jgi:hypothetical protein
MIDSFPYSEWSEQVTTFWTFGPAGGSEGGSLTGTFVLTGLGILLMIVSLIWWVTLEDSKLKRQASHLRGAGGDAGPIPPATGPSTESYS